MAYSFEQLKQAYKNLGVEKDRVVLVSGNLAYLMEFEIPGKIEVLEAHFRALMELLGKDGTLVVPTGNVDLCNTDIVFNLEESSSNMGVLSEHIRKKAEAHRSFHPFVSFAAIGRRAKEICEDVTRHAFGPETPMDRLINMDALEISIGLHPRITGSIIHHIELVMGVPYRYTKEFIHPVIRDGKVEKEPFYTHVCYRECDVQRDVKVKIFKRFLSEYTVKTEKVGRGEIYSYSLVEFYKLTVQLLKEDIFIWLKEIPKVKPYRN